MEWNDNIAYSVGSSGGKGTYTLYQIQDNGDLWIMGDAWRDRVSANGKPLIPNGIYKVGDEDRAKLVAEAINGLFDCQELNEGEEATYIQNLDGNEVVHYIHACSILKVEDDRVLIQYGSGENECQQWVGNCHVVKMPKI